MIFPKPVARSDIDSTRPTGHPRRRHPPAAFLLPGYAHPPRAEKPHHGLPALTIGPWGTAAGCATAARPAALGTGSPQDVDTGCPVAIRTRDRPAFSPRCPLARFLWPWGVLVPGQAADAANSLSRGMSWVFGDCHSLGLGSFERYVDE